MDSETGPQPADASRSIAKVSLASQYALCKDSFNKLLQSLAALDDHAVTQRLLNEFGKFRVWGGNTGVYHTGRGSLDYRLREAPHIYEKLTKFLDELNKNLEEACKLGEDGHSSHSQATHGEKSIAELGPLEDPELECQEPELSEYEYLVSDVTHIITCLYKFSIAIRDPVPKERLREIAPIDVSHFEGWDINYVNEKFCSVNRDPQNNFRTAQYLSERLGKANTRRRQLLKYYEIHHKGISGSIVSSRSSTVTDKLTNAPKQETSTVQDGRSIVSSRSSTTTDKLTNAPKQETSTVQDGRSIVSSRSSTTTDKLTNAPKQETSTVQDGSAEASAEIRNLERAATASNMTEPQTSLSTIKVELAQEIQQYDPTNDTRIQVASPTGDAAFEDGLFQCPYCFKKVEVRSLQGWKTHLFEDLQPFICTFPDCPKAYDLYGSQHEWFDHEVQLHRREWYCDACSESFSQKILIEEHMRVRHSELVTEEYFEAVISRCERAIVTDIMCPLCGINYTLQTLEEHLGLHLQEIALFALPHLGESNSDCKSDKLDNSNEGTGEKSSYEFDSDSKQPAGDLPIPLFAGIRCICGYQHEDKFIIACNECGTWQHGVCMGINEDRIPETYGCPACTPGAHHLNIETAINVQECFLRFYQKMRKKERGEKERERERQDNYNPLLTPGASQHKRVEKERERERQYKPLPMPGYREDQRPPPKPPGWYREHQREPSPSSKSPSPPPAWRQPYYRPPPARYHSPPLAGYTYVPPPPPPPPPAGYYPPPPPPSANWEPPHYPPPPPPPPHPLYRSMPTPSMPSAVRCNQSYPIDEFFDVAGVSETMGAGYCLNHMMNFVREEQLGFIIGGGLSDEELRRQLRPQAEIVSQLSTKSKYIGSKLALQLSIMSLYDLAVLIDDSASMESVESGRRKYTVMEVLHFLGRLYGELSNGMRGIKTIQFLNGANEPRADNLQKKDDINNVIGSHKFNGLRCIGAGLMRKILKPFVFTDDLWVRGTPRKLRQMKRPLLIMVITDGAVEREPKDWVEKAVESVKKCLEAGGVGAKSVVFQFARVGNDQDAEEFLRKLDEDSPVSKFVDSMSGSDLMDLIGTQSAHGGDYKPEGLQKMIEVLLGPFDNMFAQNFVSDFNDVADDFD